MISGYLKLPWFKKRGMFFSPLNLAGWIISIALLGYAGYLFFDIDSRSHSVSDTLMNWCFNCVLLAAVYFAVAFITKEGENKSKK